MISSWRARSTECSIARVGPSTASSDTANPLPTKQSSPYTLGITERCAVTSSRPTIWRHCSHSVPCRATSSLRPDMIFGKDRHLGSDTGLRYRCQTVVDLSEAAKNLWLADKAGANRFFHLNCLAATAYFLPRVEDAVEPAHIHHEPCSHCGGKLVFKDTCESPKTGSPVHFFRCEDCGHVQSVERR